MRVQAFFLLFVFSTSPHIEALSGTNPTSEIPFALSRGHVMVVEATAHGIPRMKVKIDTGATHSLLDKRIVQAASLQPSSRSYTVKAFGKSQKAQLVVLRGLRLGPILTSLPCLVADLRWAGVDAVIGMDLLARTDFTIDYTSRTVSFGPSEPLGSAVQFEIVSGRVAVPLSVGNRSLRVLVDTGVDTLVLFRKKRGGWLDQVPVLEKVRHGSLSGDFEGGRVRLGSVALADTTWSSLIALVVNPAAASVAEVDGYLGVAKLGLLRLHFDFENRLLSWTR